MLTKTSHPAGASTHLLSAVSSGKMVELTAIDGGRRLRKRLADLGLSVGQQIRVVQNHFAGPLILAVQHDTRLAIGRGMAKKIYVR